MRRVLMVSLASALVAATLAAIGAPTAGSAQQRPTPSDPEGEGNPAPGRTPRFAPLRRRAAAGPCPYVKILYDAARYVELTGDRVTANNVGYTGEIEGLTSDCAYEGDDPITVRTQVLFHLGRGPQAEGDGRTYRYWVAVTERNRAVLDKVYFDLPVAFEPGQSVASVTQEQTIVIPRADETIGGDNFEILVGFEVTPQMAEFNRSGSRFRIDAGVQAD